MRLICIGDSQKNADGRPCSILSEAISKGHISLRVTGKEGVLSALRHFPSDIAVIQQVQPNPMLVQMIRNNRFSIPILIITRESKAESVAAVLAAGADDCVSITMDPVELLARLRAIVRRVSGVGVTSQTITIGRLMLREDTREVLVDDDMVPLTHNEYDIMSLMVRRRGNLLNKSTILATLYADREKPASKTVDVMVCRIRQKLKKKGIQTPFKTSWGMGYRLNEEAFLPFGARHEDDMEFVPSPARETSMPITAGGNITAGLPDRHQ